MELIHKYFPDLSEKQVQQYAELAPLYDLWNERINVISRKDIESLYEKHILHSLAIAKFIQCKTGSKVLDIGTGGGFPAIPLSIYFDQTRFTAVDSIRKKMTVVTEISQAIGLKNLQPIWGRAEETPGTFDFVVSRAVAPLTDLFRWSHKKIGPLSTHPIRNGLICLKGSGLAEEQQTFSAAYPGYKIEEHAISQWFSESFFESKSIWHVYKG